MSKWAYAKGIVHVSPYGRTQAECRYILETVLAHLPKVTGSEENMYIHIVQCAGYNTSSNVDEFYVFHDEKIEMQDNYLIVVEGYFRDRGFEETYRAFVAWLMRLAKRVWTDSCVVQISGYDAAGHEKRVVISPSADTLSDLFEWYSWAGKGTVNWSEYLIWRNPRNKKGQRLEGKPDFPDGGCLDMMTAKERKKWLPIYPKRRG